MIKRDFVAEAEKATANYGETISSLANARLNLARLELRGDLKGDLQIVFGMGSEYIEYRGHQCSYWMDTCRSMDEGGIVWASSSPDDAWSEDDNTLSQPEELLPLVEALDDIMKITDGYSNGCPNDFKVKGEE